MAQGLSVLEELERLYVLQTRRIEIDVVNEQVAGRLTRTLHHEIREARDLLVAYHKIEARLGLVAHHKGRLEVDTNAPVVAVVKQKFGAVAGQVATQPRSVNKVLGLYNKIVALSAEATGESENVEDDGVDIGEYDDGDRVDADDVVDDVEDATG